MSLSNYWPSKDNVFNCIKSNAENASDEVLLSVHQPFPLAYLTVGSDGRTNPNSRTISNEKAMLDYFIGVAPSGSHVLPITGASGVGKSHLIRMLDARIRRLPNAHKYLIIHIPKSASLRRVVELILEAEPLKDKHYDQVKVEFTKALADIPLQDAVIRFQGELTIALQSECTRLRECCIQEPTNISLKERYGHAKDLPGLMTDESTVTHFREVVFPRIIQRSVGGFNSDNEGIEDIDPMASQFNIDDFDLSAVDFGQANKNVANYYRVNLNIRDGMAKKVAVDVLNNVVDQATHQLYNLNQNFGGMTLAEVIMDIRRLLLVDEKELVILVEDFYALVGIQDTLAKVLIQDGTTKQGQEFATIRSAIAVTDGYLDGRNTLATRAGREWIVESRLDTEDEILRRTKLLVASYLNAARIGENGLKKHYQLKIDANYLPPLYSEDEDEEDNKILQAFGYVDKVPLFPFTELAIENLARRNLTSGSSLVFNPRIIIRDIIQEILKCGREFIVKKQFPFSSISTKKPSAEIAQWLMSLVVSDVQRKQYQTLVCIWGNDPKMRSEIGLIAKEVFEVFGLPKPDIEFVSPTPTTLSTPSPILPVKTAPSDPTSLQERQIKDYQAILEGWVQNGTILEQSIANKIRNNLVTLINSNIDWNSLRCLKREIKADKISIPNAKGEQGLASKTIKIAPSSADTDGTLRGELLALLRYYEVYKSNINYDNVDDDMARIANLVERILPDALDLVRTSIEKHNQSAIMILATNSRLLGINERGRTPSAISAFLFGKDITLESLTDTDNSLESFTEWRVMQKNALQIRPQLGQLILETNGCFQGAGKDNSYGIDIVRILEHYPKDEDTLELANLQGLTQELKQSLQNMSDVRVSIRLKKVLQDAKTIQKAINDKLGPNIDKQLVINVFKDLAETLKDIGSWRDSDIGFSLKSFLNLCEEFRSTALKETLLILQDFGENEVDSQSSTKKITKGAQLRLLPLLIADKFLSSAAKIILSAESHAQTFESQNKDISPIEKAQELVCDFNDLISNLEIIQHEK
jgi:hypothetical protein